MQNTTKESLEKLPRYYCKLQKIRNSYEELFFNDRLPYTGSTSTLAVFINDIVSNSIFSSITSHQYERVLEL